MKNNYLYQGAYAELDDDIGWNDFELRNYDPQLGRWIQQDPYQEFASPYLGIGDDPVNLGDPSGGITLPFFKVVLSAANSSAKVLEAAGQTAQALTLLNKISMIVHAVATAVNIINHGITTNQIGRQLPGVSGDEDPFQRNFTTAQRRARYGNIDETFVDSGGDGVWSGINTAQTVKFIKIKNGKFESEQTVEYGNPEKPVITIIKRYNTMGQAEYRRNSSEPKIIDIKFKSNSNTYHGPMEDAYTEIVKNLKENPTSKVDIYASTNETYWNARLKSTDITIDGVHSDGTNSIDDVLEARKRTILNDLTSRGIDPSRINVLPNRHESPTKTTTKIVIQKNDGMNLPTKHEME